MMLFATLLLLVGVSVANGKGCCYPNQWQGTEGFISGSSDDQGHGALTTGSVFIAMDAGLQAIYIDETLEVNGQKKEYKVLQLYAKNAQFIITDGKCTRTAVGQWGPDIHCIPANATVSKQYYFGNQQKLTVHEYLLNVKQQTYEIGVTDDCVPVVERIYGNLDGTNVLTITGFFNISPNITNPKQFDVPAICNTAKLTSGLKLNRQRRSFFSQWD